MSDELGARVAALEAELARLRSLVEGAPAPPPATDPGDFPPEVVELALAGKKIQAIKVLRDRTGLGLADAKTVVDRIA